MLYRVGSITDAAYCAWGVCAGFLEDFPDPAKAPDCVVKESALGAVSVSAPLHPRARL